MKSAKMSLDEFKARWDAYIALQEEITLEQKVLPLVRKLMHIAGNEDVLLKRIKKSSIGTTIDFTSG